jgi:hypothetical protein
MRQVLVDHARRRAAAKRGGGRSFESLDAVLDSYEVRSGDLLALHEALGRLEKRIRGWPKSLRCASSAV